MKSIALGQYYPAESPLHRLDPRIKVVSALVYICAAAFCKNIIGFAVLLVSALLVVALGRIPFKTIFRSLTPVLFVMLFAVFFQVFFTKGDMLLFEWWKIRIYGEGLYLALFTIVRIFTLIIGTSMFLTYTTTP
ncbi:MAG: energy-coupling factor transporter transmembrane protein EcfT, partial [Clostridia bacterium]|nr:energy-coupling factor transporter transmembrane protein EcfT [Clostridia bacterium]